MLDLLPYSLSGGTNLLLAVDIPESCSERTSDVVSEMWESVVTEVNSDLSSLPTKNKT